MQKTKAVRLYGKNDLRLEEFTLPEPGDGEILAKVVTDSLCMSSYKAASQGAEHKRVPEDVATNPIIIGHEFCGELVKVGKKWRHLFSEGEKFSIQPAMSHPDNPHAAPGYSFPYIGGDATYILIPQVVMERDCLLKYEGSTYFHGSLAEPMSCIAGTFHAHYHMKPGSYVHHMGIAEGGNMAFLAGVGPMGLGAIDYALHCDRRPGLLVVTDIDQSRLDRAASIYTPEKAAAQGVRLVYVNTAGMENQVEQLRTLSGGKGYNDVVVFAPVKPLVEVADRLLAYDGCLNFFAGPSDSEFTAGYNFYNVHYNNTHVVGTSGGNNDDLREALDLMAQGIVNPTPMITHIGGLNCVPETTLALPKIPGGKKLIYTHIDMELTAIADFAEKGKSDPLLARLTEIVAGNNGLWCGEAEAYLLAHAKPI